MPKEADAFENNIPVTAPPTPNFTANGMPTKTATMVEAT